MLALLAILGTAVLIGRLARRLTPTVELLLLGLIVAIVLVEFVSWQDADGGGSMAFLRVLVPGLR